MPNPNDDMKESLTVLNEHSKPADAPPISTPAPAQPEPAPSADAVSSSSPPSSPASTPSPKDGAAPALTSKQFASRAKKEVVPEDEPAVDLDAPAPFDFTKWDGSVDKLPDHLRDYGKHFSEYYGTRTKAEREQLEQKVAELETIYRALSEGQEDPRVAQFRVERDQALEAQKAEREQRAKLDKEWAQQTWARFAKNFPQFANSEKTKKLISDLLGESWDLEDMPTLLDLPKAQLDAIREATKRGVPRHDAIDLVRLRSEAESQKSKPTSAHLVSGSDTPTGNPAAMTRGQIQKPSYDEHRLAVIRKHMSKA